MKYLLPLSLFALGAFAETPAPKAPVPAPLPNLAPDTVVAKVAGKPLTVADVKKILATLPADLQEAFLQNPKNAMQSLFLLDFLKKEADNNQLAAKSPYKEQLEMQRTQLLAQAEVARRQEQMTVSDADLQKRYEADKANFDQASVRGIYIAFEDPKNPQPKAEKGDAAAKTLTEAEAKAKAETIVKQARAGADFAELAKKHSDDKGTAEKGGDYGKMRKTDRIPDDIKNAIFSSKSGGVSEPLRQPNGFFIIKVDDRRTPAFKEVQPQLAAELKQERFKQWMETVQKQFEVTIENQDFFPKPAAPAPQGK